MGLEFGQEITCAEREHFQTVFLVEFVANARLVVPIVDRYVWNQKRQHGRRVRETTADHRRATTGREGSFDRRAAVDPTDAGFTVKAVAGRCHFTSDDRASKAAVARGICSR